MAPSSFHLVRPLQSFPDAAIVFLKDSYAKVGVKNTFNDMLKINASQASTDRHVSRRRQHGINSWIVTYWNKLLAVCWKHSMRDLAHDGKPWSRRSSIIPPATLPPGIVPSYLTSPICKLCYTFAVYSTITCNLKLKKDGILLSVGNVSMINFFHMATVKQYI